MHKTQQRLLIIPRWAGRPNSDFYPWLLETLRTSHPGRFAEARVLDLPTPELPNVTAWPQAIAEALGTDKDELSRTHVLAHSVGCQALFRALTRLPQRCKLAAALCVAGWWHLDRPWDSIKPWLAPISELERARAAVPKLAVLLSNNDPFTADYEATRRAFENQLGARVQLASGGRHFNEREEPAVLAALLALHTE